MRARCTATLCGSKLAVKGIVNSHTHTSSHDRSARIQCAAVGRHGLARASDLLRVQWPCSLQPGQEPQSSTNRTDRHPVQVPMPIVLVGLQPECLGNATGCRLPSLEADPVVMHTASCMTTARVCQQRSDASQRRVSVQPTCAPGEHTDKAAGKLLVDLCESPDLVSLFGSTEAQAGTTCRAHGTDSCLSTCLAERRVCCAL
jgi:hypothetical protein